MEGGRETEKNALGHIPVCQIEDYRFFILLCQTLVPDAVPLVEALLHDLLATTHNLKVCKEQRRLHEGELLMLSSVTK